MKQERNIWIDFIRSIAIIIMIIANSAAVIGNKDYSYFFRVICSLAAPLFVLLSGISFSVSSKYPSTSDTKTKSALYLLITASCIDLFIWQIPPFNTFDVLYIIAFGIFLNIFLKHKTLLYVFSFIISHFKSFLNVKAGNKTKPNLLLTAVRLDSWQLTQY